MKKTYKWLAAAAGSLLVLAAMVGCSASIEDIQLDAPVVTAESKFGANVISWEKIDKASKYYVYRQEVIPADKKAKEEAPKEEYTKLEYLGAVNQISRSDEELYFVDSISISNVMEEGKTYHYTVEALAGDGSDARFGLAEVTDKSFIRGVGAANVTVAEGNMPAYGTKVTAPEKTTFKAYVSNNVFNYNAGGRVVIDSDVLADNKAVRTYSYAELVGFGEYGMYTNGVEYVCQIWGGTGVDNPMTLPLPGTYKIATYNQAGNNYYQDSEFVYAEETVTVSLDKVLSQTYTTPYFNISVNNNLVNLSWTSPKVNVNAGVTYKLYKADYEYRWSNKAGKDVYNLGEIAEVEAEISTIADADGSLDYECYDKVEEGKKYIYFLQAYLGDDLIGANWRSVSAGQIAEKNLKGQSWEIGFDPSFKETAVGTFDEKTNKVTAFDYYAFFNVPVTNATATLTRAVINAETGLHDEVTVTPAIEETYTDMYFVVEDKALPFLTGKDAGYKYTLTITDEDGMVSIYYWIADGYRVPEYAYLDFASVTEKEVTANKAVYTVELVNSSEPEVDLSKVTVKAIVFAEVDASSKTTLGSKYTIKSYKFSGFKKDALSKDVELDKLEAGTDYKVIFVIEYDTTIENTYYGSSVDNFTTLAE